MSATAYGIVNANGSKRSGEGFSSIKVDNGHYMISFVPKFSTPPSVVVSVVEEGFSWNAVVLAVTEDNCRIETGNPRKGGDAADDIPFSFIAMG
ncbi:hypothetical protein ACIQF6_33555 [Kitasatospora sp. NPDC092948]|uniref:hypothetical protein n=1 Tax=Kitasatospora sp. NPDC092948 TaxID=3364088 RepID=UPI0038159CE7